MNAIDTPECRIAEISALFGLTLRAIRLYEEQGLVQPRRDGLNRRRYGAEARRRLQLIAQLRRAGVDLAEIRCLLEAAGPPERQAAQIAEALAARIGRLEAQTRQARAVLGEIEAAARSPRDTAPARLAVAGAG